MIVQRQLALPRVPRRHRAAELGRPAGPHVALAATRQSCRRQGSGAAGLITAIRTDGRTAGEGPSDKCSGCRPRPASLVSRPIRNGAASTLIIPGGKRGQTQLRRRFAPQRPPHSPPARPSRRRPIRRGPVTFVNPFPPGGAVDVVARPLAAVLEPILKQPVVIETKAGAAGQVGAQFAASAKPDGYTLLMHIVSISGFAEVDKLFGRPVKFTRDDFIPIARFIADPMVLVVNDKQPYKTLKEFVDDAKKRPNEIDLQLVGTLRRAASADGAVHEGGRHPDAASADRRRRAGADRDPRQQLAGAGVLDRGRQRPDEGRQAAAARLLRRAARAGAARRADHEGARLRHRVLSVGRPVRAQGHARQRSSRRCATPRRRPPRTTSSSRR